ncbi:hypothetical protein OFM21_32800, partial [Escherichia coli]|nr:hypothetical protein [Escherichia coli]
FVEELLNSVASFSVKFCREIMLAHHIDVNLAFQLAVFGNRSVVFGKQFINIPNHSAASPVKKEVGFSLEL